MTTRIQLPPGCSGLDSRDGTRYTASRPGGSVVIEDQHAAEMKRSKRSRDSSSGLLSLKQSFSFGTREGRRCETCRRTWNGWSFTCPKCGADTVPE